MRDSHWRRGADKSFKATSHRILFLAILYPSFDSRHLGCLLPLDAGRDGRLGRSAREVLLAGHGLLELRSCRTATNSARLDPYRREELNCVYAAIDDTVSSMLLQSSCLSRCGASLLDCVGLLLQTDVFR